MKVRTPVLVGCSVGEGWPEAVWQAQVLQGGQRGAAAEGDEPQRKAGRQRIALAVEADGSAVRAAVAQAPARGGRLLRGAPRPPPDLVHHHLRRHPACKRMLLSPRAGCWVDSCQAHVWRAHISEA